MILFGAQLGLIVEAWMTFTPEISKSLGLEPISTHKAVLYTYLGITFGDFILVALSQILKSRISALRLAHVMGVVLGTYLIFNPPKSEFWYLIWIFVVATFTTNWGVVVLSCAEKFGTNFRALATTSLPNFIRASGLLSVEMFRQFYAVYPFSIALLVIVLWCFVGLSVSVFYKYTFGNDLNYVEK
ncbi:MAG: hypothetical protein NZO16_08015 [Deltaproteobacteria bacterium]|nr:hypothetical protein [Deltaproteobacteria bacterium]